MNSLPTLSFFATRSKDGLELIDRLQGVAQTKGFKLKLFREGASGTDYVRECSNADVVVLDATIERAGQHNYGFTMPLPLDHVLVVSRTPLPLNFYGLRAEITRTDGRSICGAPGYGQALSNPDIVEWLIAQLESLRPDVPRQARDKGYFRALRSMQTSLDRLDEQRRATGNIFISYRSCHFDRVARLRDNVAREGQRPVRFFPPGILALDLLTEQRRWQILSMIDRFVGPAEDVWIYETEDYYNSWWTLGELVTLAYRRCGGYRGKPPPRLSRIEPTTGKLSPLSDDFLPRLTEAQRRRMARLYVNSDSAQVAPEAVVTMRVLSQVPLIGRLRYLHDHVWSDLFWRHPILDCWCCRRIGERKNDIDIDAFLALQDPGAHRLSPEMMLEALAAGELVCPGCRRTYRIEAAEPQYVWVCNANGHPVGRYFAALMGLAPPEHDETSIVMLPSFRLLDSSSGTPRSTPGREMANPLSH